MGPVDLFLHLCNLFAVALLFGLTAATGARVMWRRQLASVPWVRLAVAVSGAAMAVTLLGLLLFGRDGRMATYGLMVIAGPPYWLLRRIDGGSERHRAAGCPVLQATASLNTGVPRNECG